MAPRAGMDRGEPSREWAGEAHLRGTRATIADMVCHQVNHAGLRGFAGKPWLDMQNKERPRRSGAQLSIALQEIGKRQTRMRA